MNKKFSREEKYQLVSRYYNGESVSDICIQEGISKSAFYTWLKPYKTTVTNSGYEVSQNEFIKMKQRLDKLEKIIEVLKKVNCTNQATLQEKLKELALLHGQYSVYVLCEALNISRGTFYNHILRNKKENNSYQFRRTSLSEQIKRIYEESHQIYGMRKIKAILNECGITISEKMVTELMREMNLSSI